jgi:Asp-tRNA(Asn)/Glu-tRNA(Gln) amidotransferase A subunit family amidase
MIQAARMATAADYARAVRVLHATGRRVARFFETVDVLVTPTMALPTPRIGEIALAQTPGAAFGARLGASTGYTALFNAAGNPALSLPLGKASDGMPLGVQFAGRAGDEATLFRLGAQLERARPWFAVRPPLAGVG